MGAPNPASEYCVDNGGTLVIQTKVTGGQYGICDFGNNSECEEWAMFREECPMGGVDISQYSTLEGFYCAITGGVPSNEETQCEMGALCVELKNITTVRARKIYVVSELYRCWQS